MWAETQNLTWGNVQERLKSSELPQILLTGKSPDEYQEQISKLREVSFWVSNMRKEWGPDTGNHQRTMRQQWYPPFPLAPSMSLSPLSS